MDPVIRRGDNLEDEVGEGPRGGGDSLKKWNDDLRDRVTTQEIW